MTTATEMTETAKDVSLETRLYRDTLALYKTNHPGAFKQHATLTEYGLKALTSRVCFALASTHHDFSSPEARVVVNAETAKHFGGAELRSAYEKIAGEFPVPSLT